MCGIAGIFASNDCAPLDITADALGMVRKLTHRGPDDEGVWSELSFGISFAHRRLSILDRTKAGHQPMHSHCGRYVIVLNGEIYNHQAIRQELLAQNLLFGPKEWVGSSDTETLLAAISCWGLNRALNKLVGMFAFALWDRANKTLYLVRDRIGEKPLYYGLCKGALLFASELKAIRAYPGFRIDVDRASLALFLRHNVVPGPRSIFRGVFKLLPGSILKITKEDVSKGILDSPELYWSLPEMAIAGQANLFEGSALDACDELERHLRRSVAEQSLADVPVGAFLSGGIDSSTIVALMQAQSRKSVSTFSIGFLEAGYNEAQQARAVANHLGTDHTELYITPEQAQRIIPSLPTVYDEPFADASQIPTFLVSELAKRKVTVCLSGDGGDELFGGYSRYLVGASIWRYLDKLPRNMRSGLATAIHATIRTSNWDAFIDGIVPMLPDRWRVRSPKEKLYKIVEMLTASSGAEAYLRLVSNWINPEQALLGSNFSLEQKQRFILPNGTLEHQMMCTDSLTYLPDDILVKLDRAAMGLSLETRVPFLDHRVVEFAWRLPQSLKLRGGVGKWILRQMAYRYIPKDLIDRPKAGFSVPIGAWLRGPLREWAEDLLDEGRLKREGYFNPAPIRAKWTEHISGKGNWQNQLWAVLMFEAWLEKQ